MYIDSDQERQTVREIVLKTNYGDVFSLQVGEKGQPLILIIHGSGPKNSSKKYETILQQYAVRISMFEKYYILAIDCPGYGKSTGSKESIKTFPLQFLKNILEVLNYKSYYALFGHSQGGAAIFNAVYQYPNLTEYMVQQRPVCGNISRFNKFQIPTLLIYDIEDDGHPLWQGKQLFKQLKNSQLFTFKSSVNPYYVFDNIWNLMLQFFDKYKRFNKGNKIPRSQSRDQQIKKPKQSKQQIKRQHSVQCQKRQQSHDSTETGSQSTNKFKKKQQKQKDTKYELQKIQQSSLQLNVIDEKQQCSYLIIQNKNKNPEIKQEQIVINEVISQPQQIQKVQKQQQQIQQPLGGKQQISKQQQQNKCSLCLQIYFHPTRINCKHIFCWRCITQAMLVNPKCPLCRTNIQNRQQNNILHQELIAKMEKAELNKRLNQYKKFLKMMESIVFIEVGNTSILLNTKQSSFNTTTKKKYNWELFVQQTQNFKFDSIQFNINMGDRDSKPVKVKQFPWTFANRGTFEFGCQIKIIPKSAYFNPLVVIYRICLEPGRHSRKVAVKRKQFK